MAHILNLKKRAVWSEHNTISAAREVTFAWYKFLTGCGFVEPIQVVLFTLEKKNKDVLWLLQSRIIANKQLVMNSLFGATRHCAKLLFTLNHRVPCNFETEMERKQLRFVFRD